MTNPGDALLECLKTSGSGGTRLKDLVIHLVNEKGIFSCEAALSTMLHQFYELKIVVLLGDRYYLPNRLPKKKENSTPP